MHIEELSAIEEIKQVKARYCRFVDTKRWSDFAGLFTLDAMWDVGEFSVARNPATGERIKTAHLDLEFMVSLAAFTKWPVIGRENIKAVAQEGTDSTVTVHKIHLPEVEIISATNAKAIWPMEDMLYFPAGGKIRWLQGMGHYHETYERLEGQWLIKTVKLSRLWVNAE